MVRKYKVINRGSANIGCLTCRRRKVKCDGLSPCKACSRLGLKCQSAFDKNICRTVLTSESFKKSSKQRGSSNISSHGAKPRGETTTSISDSSPENLQNLADGLCVHTPDSATYSLLSNSDVSEVEEMPIFSILENSNLQIPRSPASSCPAQEDLLISHYEKHMRHAHTLRQSNFSYYSLLIPTLKGSMNTLPLRSSLLAWTAFDIEKGASLPGISHYQSASGTVDRLMGSFATDSTTMVKVGTSYISDMEVIVLTIQFLSKCDTATRNITMLTKRMQKFCQWVLPRVDSLSECLSPLGCRAVFWLLHKSIRCFLFKTEINREIIEIFRHQESLVKIADRGQLYLAACYGEEYPVIEWIDDLELDVIKHKMKLLRILTIFTHIIELRERKMNGTMYIDLAKDIHKEIYSLWTEFDQDPLTLTDFKTLSRVDFHWMTDLLMLNSAAIVLNNLVDVSSDGDSENSITPRKCAENIFWICLTIKKSNPSHASYYSTWPLALVFASLVAEDPIRQDWILDYFSNILTYRSVGTDILSLLKEISRQKAFAKSANIFEIVDRCQLNIFI
jgi:Fungal Zn(2)-Cys(6) binuclear cluster domain